MVEPYFTSEDKRFYLLEGDSMKLLSKFDFQFDMVFADPPYFLSNGGLSIQSGKIVSVNKGNWDKSKGFDYVNNFNRKWLKLVRERMKDDATIWVSGTMHNIFSVGQILTELGFKILNIITWQKTNPPPNFSCRYFTYSTEQIIWARKHKHISHYFNYELMKQLNGNKQMKDVWTLPAIARWEKSCGKHPTQKPLSVLTRLILASTKPNAWILDPFTGSSTTGIAANLANRRFVGIDQEKVFLEKSKNRKLEIENPIIADKYRQKIRGFNNTKEFDNFLQTEIQEDVKIALGYCRKKDLKILEKESKFYFHAIEKDNVVRGFPSEIMDTKKLFIYRGGRGKPFVFTGYFGEIEKIQLKHKSTIEGKENSKTEFYYEVDISFNFDKQYQFKANLDILFGQNNSENLNRMKKFVPSICSQKSLLANQSQEIRKKTKTS